MRIDRIFRARAHLAAHADDELVAQGFRLVERFLAHRRLIVNDLYEPRTVTHIDEDQTAVIPSS